MTHEEILREIEALAHEHLDDSRSLRPEMNLRQDLELDSLQWITLAIEVENRFRIYLEDEDEATIQTVGDFVETIHRKLQEAESSGN